MNWGKGITITIILFVSFIMYLVFTCMKQTDINLVSADYYEQEVAYQQVIDKKNNLEKLGGKPVVSVLSPHQLVVDMSELSSWDHSEGNIYMFRPSNPSLDQQFNLSLDQNGKQVLTMNQLASGKWIAKISWSRLGTEYYYEQTVMVP
ncbi:MAG: FixH family protein [Flavobacteriales bacterium]|nr:FixH family protein [Flavobacteriales bacterium]